GFLYLIGILNLVVLVGIMKVFRAMRRGDYDEKTLEEHLNNRGFMNRWLGGLTKSVTKSWHIYPIGLLFGLGFDTATEVGLLVITSGPLAWLGDLDLNKVGFFIVGLFVLTWVMALGIWRFARIEDKWAAALAPEPLVVEPAA